MGNLGMWEILMILVIALIVFGPRKLPELGKSLGQSLAQFRRASEDFKRQWEDEVDHERRRIEAPPPSTVAQSSVEEVAPSTETEEVAPSTETEVNSTGLEEPASDRETGDVAPTVPRDETVAADTKRDWL